MPTWKPEMAVDTDKLAKAIAEAAKEYERQYGHLPGKAKVTPSKSDTGAPDPEDVAVGYTIPRYGVSLPAAEASVRTHFAKAAKDESSLGAANTGLDRAAEWLAYNKTTQSKEAAYKTAASRALAEELADKLMEYNFGLTPEQALARVYERHPELYQAELSVSDLLDHRQTQATGEAGRFA